VPSQIAIFPDLNMDPPEGLGHYLRTEDQAQREERFLAFLLTRELPTWQDLLDRRHQMGYLVPHRSIYERFIMTSHGPYYCYVARTGIPGLNVYYSVTEEERRVIDEDYHRRIFLSERA